MKKEFFVFIKDLDEKTYMEYYITYLISPVFTGVKPSSLIGLDNRNRSLLNHWYAIGDTYLEKYNLKSMTFRLLKNPMFFSKT
jgi:hypothetical protein